MSYSGRLNEPHDMLRRKHEQDKKIIRLPESSFLLTPRVQRRLGRDYLFFGQRNTAFGDLR